jgi:hypothetical protein
MDGGGFPARAYVGPWDLPVGGDCGGGAPQNRFPEGCKQDTCRKHTLTNICFYDSEKNSR